MGYEEDDREDEWRQRLEFGEPGGRLEFAEPGGNSALRAASKSNPRNLPCPTCGDENVLTPADRARGYQCNRCADADEGLFPSYGS